MSSRVPGSQVIAVIAAEAERVRAAAVESAEKRDAAVARLNELNETHNTVLTKLAEITLPSLDRAAIESSHAGVRQRLRELADRRRRSEEELAARKRRLQDDLGKRQQTVDEAVAVAAARTKAFQDRRAELEEFLNNDQDYQAMKAGCDTTQQRLERDRIRLDEVEKDAKEKLPDYEKSRLFQYLLTRKFGTNQYAASGMTKALDRKVARIIDYASLRESYRFLTTVPQLMRDQLQEREAEVDELVDQMMSSISQAEQTFGLPGLEADAKDAAEVVERVQVDRDRTAEQVEKVEKELVDVRSNENRFYTDAINELKRFLEGVESEVLERDAARTESIDDDDAVAELRACRLSTDAAAAIVETANSEARAGSELADGLEYILRRARQTDLGSERAHFQKSFDVREALRQYQKGVIDRKRLLDVLKDAAELDPTWAERAYERGSDIANSQTAQILIGTAARAAEPLLREALRRRMR